MSSSNRLYYCFPAVGTAYEKNKIWICVSRDAGRVIDSRLFHDIYHPPMVPINCIFRYGIVTDDNAGIFSDDDKRLFHPLFVYILAEQTLDLFTDSSIKYLVQRRVIFWYNY